MSESGPSRDFNYLIGLDVASGSCWTITAVITGLSRHDARSRVHCRHLRETEGWTEEDYKSDRDFVAKHKFTEGADVIYVNGDSLIPGAQALEGVFKAKMFADVRG